LPLSIFKRSLNNDNKPSKTNEAQVKANVTQNEKRKGVPSFSAIRFDKPEDEENLKAINLTIESFGSTKKNTVVAAFKLLQKNFDSKEII
jgi:hypothetical protein